MTTLDGTPGQEQSPLPGDLTTPGGARAARPGEGRPIVPAGVIRAMGFALGVGALVVWGSPPLALVGGIAFALSLGNPLPKYGHKLAKYLLQACVVLLGFATNLPTLLRAGLEGSLFAAVTIGSTLLLGYWVGRALRVDRNTSALISAGTAICGGSAIAAVGCVLAATEGEIAVAIGTVFLLNAVALYLFPLVGHALHLSAHQFGVWSGVAIHDISSVAGASLVYGPGALGTATAVKLSRSLWIVPLTLAIAFIRGQRRRGETGAGSERGDGASRSGPRLRLELPWFIGLFLVASLARSYIPAVAHCSPLLSVMARGGFTAVLCLIGASLTRRTLRAVSWKPALQGLLLWGFISVASLCAILFGHLGRWICS